MKSVVYYMNYSLSVVKNNILLKYDDFYILVVVHFLQLFLKYKVIIKSIKQA